MLRSFPRSLVPLVLLVLTAFAIGGATPAERGAAGSRHDTLPSISLGQDHGCALRSNGSVWCWSNDPATIPATHGPRLPTRDRERQPPQLRHRHRRDRALLGR